MNLRFAPAASGSLHVGNLRVLLINHLLSVSNNSDLILRIDFSNTVAKESEDKLISGIKNLIKLFDLNIKHNFCCQRDRFERYEQILNLLIARKYVYVANDIAYFNVKKNRSDLHVIRFHDAVVGRSYKKIIHIHNPVVYSYKRKLFFYNFMSVIDDIDHKITHVVRGNDHIDNTYLQILMFEAITASLMLNINLPQFCHIPMCVTDSGKISKSDGDRYSIDNLIHNEKIFPKVLMNCLVECENFKINKLSKGQKSISVKTFHRENKLFMSKNNSEVVQGQIHKVFDRIVDIYFIDIFKNFVTNVTELMQIYDRLLDPNALGYCSSTEYAYLQENIGERQVEVYNTVGKAFGFQHVGKEIIEFLGHENTLKRIKLKEQNQSS